MTAPANGGLVERVSAAIEAAEVGYSMRLTRLVDGVATYTLTYSDGSEPLEFDCTDDVYEHVRHKRALARATAAVAVTQIEALVEALRDCCASMEYWAGCDEGCSPDVAGREIMSAGGCMASVAYGKARTLLNNFGGQDRG